MFHTITAKFPGTCKRCKGTIYKGDRIRYAGPGRTYHFAAACGDASQNGRQTSQDARSETIGDAFDRMLEDRAADTTAEYGDR